MHINANELYKWIVQTFVRIVRDITSTHVQNVLILNYLRYQKLLIFLFKSFRFSLEGTHIIAKDK